MGQQLSRLGGGRKGANKGRATKSEVFGLALSEIVADGEVAPPLMLNVIDFFTRVGLREEGLFRVAGDARQLAELRKVLDRGGVVQWGPEPPTGADGAALAPECTLGGEEDSAVVAQLLKMLFRELPEPLFPTKSHKALFGAARENRSDAAGLAQAVKTIIHDEGLMPPKHLACASTLFGLLVATAAEKPTNKMSSTALSVVWAPNLLREAEDKLNDMEAIQNVQLGTEVVKVLIEQYDTVFSESVRNKSKRALKLS